MFIEALVAAAHATPTVNNDNSLSGKLDSFYAYTSQFWQKYDWDSFVNLMHIKGAKYENNKLTFVENTVRTEIDLLNKEVREFSPADVPTNEYRRDYLGNEWLNGKLIHEKDNNGIEWWHDYDSNGKLIHIKNSNGIEVWYDYDSKGKPIHEKYSCGVEWWRDYDSNGNEIHVKYSDGHEYWCDYDSNGKLIHKKDIDGHELWYDYDSNGKLIHGKYSDGTEYWCDFNSKGKPIHKKDSHGQEWWYDYDSKGNEIHKKDSDGTEFWYDTDGTKLEKGFFNFLTHAYEKKIEELKKLIQHGED